MEGVDLRVPTRGTPTQLICRGAPCGYPGSTVSTNIFILVQDVRALPLALQNENRQSILATIDTIHSQQPSRTAAEIEQQIQETRDGWEN